MYRQEAERFRTALEQKLEDLRQRSQIKPPLAGERWTDPIDQLQANESFSLTIWSAGLDWETRKAVETALEAMEDGLYGVCQECGRRIHGERLKAIPWTVLCAPCQTLREEEDRAAALDSRSGRPEVGIAAL